MHENRETSSLAALVQGSPAGKGDSRTSGMNGGEESDGVVVPMNPANKAMARNAGVAEWGEGRMPTKENIDQLDTFLTQRRIGVHQGLVCVRQGDLTLSIQGRSRMR